MKKLTALLLVLIWALGVTGCGQEQVRKVIPVPEYPLRREVLEAAMTEIGLPDDLTVEENDLLEYEGIESTSFTLRHPTKEVFAGACMGILTHRSDQFTSIGITVSSIDQEEAFSKEEIELAIRFATYLFWQDGTDTRVYDAFMEEYTEGEPLFWENEIDGIDCTLAYTPDQRQPKFKIAFSTDMEAQLGNR